MSNEIRIEWLRKRSLDGVLHAGLTHEDAGPEDMSRGAAQLTEGVVADAADAAYEEAVGDWSGFHTPDNPELREQVDRFRGTPGVREDMEAEEQFRAVDAADSHVITEEEAICPVCGLSLRLVIEPSDKNFGERYETVDGYCSNACRGLDQHGRAYYHA